jgi:hypothetical protein
MEKKSINQRMRALHRDIGFFIIGLVVIYVLSGIALIYRDTDFLKHNVKIEKLLSKNMQPSELKKSLHMKDLKVINSEGDTLFFDEGKYIKSTGIAQYTIKENIFPFNKFIGIHKVKSKNPLHWINTIFGLLLLFMVFSSFWMFKKGTALFRRGIIIAAVGLLLALILFLI